MPDTPRLPAVFAALADPTRLRLFERLAEGRSMTATELAGEVPVSRQAVAKHLGVLDAAGLVTRSAVGREVRYTASGHHLGDVVEWAANVGAEWDQRLARLRDELR